MQKFLLLSFLFTIAISSSQEIEEDSMLFSEALELYLDDYNQQADIALQNGNLEYAKNLFDTLVSNHLENTYLDKLNFEGYKNFLSSTDDFDKPTIILTYTSWCIPSKGEIPALNALANKYSDLMNFVVLYWDKKEVVKAMAKQFDQSIDIVYVDERQNKHMQTVNLLKNALGLQLCFVISASGEILDINRRPPNYLNDSVEDSLARNVSFISEQVAAVYLDLNININDLPESLVTF